MRGQPPGRRTLPGCACELGWGARRGGRRLPSPRRPAPERTNGARGRDLAELKEAVKDGAVLAHVEALQLAQVLVHVVGRHGAQKIHVVVRVETSELGRVNEGRAEDVLRRAAGRDGRASGWGDEG